MYANVHHTKREFALFPVFWYVKIAGCGQLLYHNQQETELQVAVSGGKRMATIPQAKKSSHQSTPLRPPQQTKHLPLPIQKKTAAFCPPAALRLLPPNSPAHGHVSAVLQGTLWAIEERILQLHSLIGAEWILRNLSHRTPTMMVLLSKMRFLFFQRDDFQVPLTNFGKKTLLGTHYPPGN